MGPATFIPVDDLDDPRLAPFRRRDPQLNPGQPDPSAPSGRFVAEGDLVVRRALAAGCRPEALLVDPASRTALAGPAGRLGADVPVFVAGESMRRSITGLAVALDVIGLFHRPPAISAETVTLGAFRIVVVEQVDNPSNLGTIIRSAAALGWDGLIVDRTSADPLARRSVRVSMGSVFAMPFARVGEVPDELGPVRGSGWRLVALTPGTAATPLDQFVVAPGDRIALVLGSERHGLSAGVLAACEPVRIPMHVGVDSLNVAAAAAIACYELGRDRSEPAG